MPSSSSSHNLSFGGSAARLGSPLLRPSSPLYVNVQGSSPTGNEFGKMSPGSEGSSAGSSPDARRGTHFGRAMERSSSGGSIGSSSNHLLPLSPRSSLSKRTASPSRVYAVPTSPRLRALGGISHTRKLSGGSLSHLGESSSSSSSTQPIDADPGLPIDSVWPGGLERRASASSIGEDAIPIGVNKGLSTPVPPSLRDELSPSNSNSAFSAIYPRPASPNVRALSVSPQDEFYLYRHHRTPSPSTLASSQKRRSSGSPASGSPSPKVRPHSSPSLLPTLAAPKAISKRTFNLEAGQYAPSQPSFIPRRHSRTLSSSSSGSNRSDTEPTDGIGLSPSRDEKSPTEKVLSPPEGAYAKLDAQNAIAEVNLGPSMVASQGEAAELSDQSRDEGAAAEVDSNEGKLSSLETTKAFASAHGIPFSDLPSNKRNSLVKGSPQSSFNGIVMIGPDGSLVRARSPAIPSPRMETVPLGESPPKTRSFIGMPPRSGYDLSDDPDDVGSDSGSTGSGRNSINEDRDNEDDDDILEDQDEDFHGNNTNQDERGGDTMSRPSALPRRPSLTLTPVVAAAPGPYNANSADETMQVRDKEQTVKRVDLALTRDEGKEEDEDDDEIANEQDQNGFLVEQSQQDTFEVAPEESLSTLERIFLFAKSEMTYHRVLVSHSLSDWIIEVELSDAVEFVIPLLNGLACDENEVCTAFAPHLHRVMWYFFRNCPLVEDGDQQKQSDQEGDVKVTVEDDSLPERATRPKISVGVFTPLLCALLLNYNAAIAGSTQSSIVRFFARLQGFDFLEPEEEDNIPEEEQMQPQTQQFSSGKAQSKMPFDPDTSCIRDAAAREDKRVLLEDYEFSQTARQMIMDELLHNVALAIGNLNVEQTTHAREMTSQDEKPAHGNLNSIGDGEDAVMDDIPLTSEGALDVTSEGNDETEVNALNSTSQEMDSGDTEMSMDFLEDVQEQSLAAGRTSIGDNDSITMSDVEEEVAVGRMASISLLAALGAEELVTRDFLIGRIVPELVRSSADHTFFVRKEVAVAMGALAKCIGYQELKQKDLLTIFERFCRDRIWHVRQAACLSLPNLFAQVVDGEVKRVKVVDTMRLFVNDVSHNVRVAALDIIGEMIYLFYEDPNGVPLELVRHFMGESYDLEAEKAEEEAVKHHISGSIESSGSESMMQESQGNINGFADSWGGLRRSISTTNANGPTGWSSDNSQANNSYKSSFHNADLMDSDRPLVMAYNFPAVMLTLGKEHWPKLKSVHGRLCNSISPKARRSLAASLHEIAKIIGIESTSEDLLELVQHFLDSDIEKDEQVKMAMLQNLDVFMEQLTLDKALETLKYLLQLWNEESNGDSTRLSGNWRLREKVISLIPNLARQYLMKDDEGVLVVLMQSAIVDSVSSVRSQGIKIVGNLYHIFEENDQVLADGFLGMLVDVGENESYRGRVACLHCLSELCKSQLQRSSVEMLMMNRLVELSKDDVVDVRIALAQLVSLMCRMDELYALPSSRSEEFVNLLRRLFYDRSELVGRILMSAVQEGDPGREPPNPWPSPRPARELVLGPSDGSLHRPPISEQSFDMNGDSTREVQSFDMDDEEQSPAQQQIDTLSSSKEIAPLLQNSMLMKRRSQHRPHAQLDADSSMFEDADDDEDLDAKQESSTDRNGQMTDNSLMLSTNSIGDDSFERDDAHHLLGTASDSPVRDNASNEQNHGLSLESPERPWKHSSNAETGTSDQYLNENQDSASKISNSKTSDPFLAFVADKQHDRDGNDQQEQNQTHGDDTLPAGVEEETEDSS
jgi:serine/threonine-protein phosphatase 4 regulatory subunit 1